MNKEQALVNSIKIATPCSVDWNEMTGDDRMRFCGSCKLNVYNFSEMSRKEIANLIGQKEGRICAQLYRRKDGTVLTRDCPVAVQRVKKAYRRSVACVLGIVASLGINLPSLAQQQQQEPSHLGGAIAVDPEPAHAPDLKVSKGECNIPISQPVVVQQKKQEPRNPILPWVMMATIFGSLIALLKRRKSMWVIGTTMAALFAVLGYFWCIGA